jgi:hypothetical protein
LALLLGRYLDFNPLKKITAGQLPSSLIELYMEKANIDSLAGFKFPNQLKILSIKGNRQLTSLYGLVLPTGITTLYVPVSRTNVTGNRFSNGLSCSLQQRLQRQRCDRSRRRDVPQDAPENVRTVLNIISELPSN